MIISTHNHICGNIVFIRNFHVEMKKSRIPLNRQNFYDSNSFEQIFLNIFSRLAKYDSNVVAKQFTLNSVNDRNKIWITRYCGQFSSAENSHGKKQFPQNWQIDLIMFASNIMLHLLSIVHSTCFGIYAEVYLYGQC